MTGNEKPILDMSEGTQSPESETPQVETTSAAQAGEVPVAQSFQPDHMNASAPDDETDATDDVPPSEIPPGEQPDGELMSAPRAMLILAVSVASALLGWFIYTEAAIPTATISVLISTALLSVFRTLRSNRWILHGILLVAATTSYIMVLFTFYPLWYTNFNNFSNDLIGIVEKGGETISTGTKEDTSITTTSVNVVTATTKAVGGYLALNLRQRFRILGQMVLFSTTVFLVVLVILGVTPGLGNAARGAPPKGFLAWFGPGTYRCINGIGMFGLARVLKAITISVTCGLGLRLAGFTSAPFIAGTVFCVALVSYLSPAVALLLGLVTVVATGKWLMAVYLIGVCIVLSVAEKKLYWLLRLFPFFRRYLPERTEGAGAIGKTIGWAARIAPHLLSVGMLAAVVFFCYQVYDVYTVNVARATAVKEADNLMNETQDYRGAFDKYFDITYRDYKGHPANLRLCHKMLECQLKSRRYAKAVQTADALAGYNPAAPTDIQNPEKPEEVKESGETYLNRFRYETAKFLADKAIKDHRAEEGYELIIQKVHKLSLKEILTDLGQKTLAIDDSNLWGLLAAARGAFLSGNYTEAIAHCRKGLSKKPSMLELLHVQASAHLANGDYDDCANLCDKILEHDPDDTDARPLKRTAMRKKEKQTPDTEN